MRVVLACVVCFLLGCSNGHDATISGTVVGGSMYPTLKGERLQVQCESCTICFEIDGLNVPRNKRAVCPNCGHSENRISEAVRLPAQSIEIHPTDEPIERWDLICFRNQVDEKLIVKRVVGLPGETISIRDGDLFVDQKRLSPASELPDLRVFELRSSRAFGELPPRVAERFTNTLDGRNWSWANGCWNWAAKASVVDDPIDWLEYRHRRCYSHSQESPWVDVVQDHIGFNQTLSRQLNSVRRLKIAVDVDLSNNSQTYLQFGRFIVRLANLEKNTFALGMGWMKSPNSVRKLEGLLSNVQWAKTKTVECADPGRVEILFSNYGATEFWVGGEQVLSDTISGSDTGLDPVPERSRKQAWDIGPIFRVASLEGELKVLSFSIDRSVYWLGPAGLKTESIQLGADEYYVLGDNPPLSRDSRQFEKAGIKRSQIVGKVSLVDD